MDNENMFKFIKIIENNECLWCRTSKAYPNKTLRDEIWRSIGEQFQMTGEEAYILFRKLREKYRREIEKPAGKNGSAARSEWLFLHSMQFVDTAYKKRKLSTSQISEADSAEILCSSRITLEAGNNKSTAVAKNEATPGDSSWSTSSIGAETMLEAIQESTNKMIAALKAPPASQHEDVMAFVRGTFNSLPKDEACKLEKDIMDICMKYRYKDLK